MEPLWTMVAVIPLFKSFKDRELKMKVLLSGAIIRTSYQSQTHDIHGIAPKREP